MTPEILYRDAHLVVAVKPCGVLSEDGVREEGMPALMQKELGGAVYPVHRLDRTTEGLIVYARTRQAAAALSAGELRKTYLAAVEGIPDSGGELSDLLYYDRSRNKSYVVSRERRGVKHAALRYERLGTAEYEGKAISLVRVVLITGRTHQIRVQFASRRHPLVGDRRYGSSVPAEQIALCACGLRFLHPVSGEELRFDCAPTNKVFQLF